MEFSIRVVREEDAKSIVEILNPIIQDGCFTIMETLFSEEDQVSFIRGLPAKSVYHVAIRSENQEVLGIQDVLPYTEDRSALAHVGEISTFVSLDAHRSGVGRGLSQETFRVAKERGFQKLMAAIRADNPHAISFYQSQGFEQIGTAKRHVQLRGRYIDEVFMEKFID